MLSEIWCHIEIWCHNEIIENPHLFFVKAAYSLQNHRTMHVVYKSVKILFLPTLMCPQITFFRGSFMET